MSRCAVLETRPRFPISSGICGPKASWSPDGDQVTAQEVKAASRFWRSGRAGTGTLNLFHRTGSKSRFCQHQRRQISSSRHFDHRSQSCLFPGQNLSQVLPKISERHGPLRRSARAAGRGLGGGLEELAGARRRLWKVGKGRKKREVSKAGPGCGCGGQEEAGGAWGRWAGPGSDGRGLTFSPVL